MNSQAEGYSPEQAIDTQGVGLTVAIQTKSRRPSTLASAWMTYAELSVDNTAKTFLAASLLYCDAKDLVIRNTTKLSYQEQ
jgi:hypothetical protein